MKILNKSNEQIIEVSNKRQIARMLRYKDLFEEVKEEKTDKTVEKKDKEKTDKTVVSE